MDKESREIVDTLVSLCWYMRGGLNIEDAYNTTHDERVSMSQLIKRNIETSKETGQVII